MSAADPPTRPFRWDLAGRDQLGSLLDGCAEPDLWFRDELLVCAARVLAGCADGDVYFVGRSADSLFDLLGGCLADTRWGSRLHQLPLSLYGSDGENLTPGEVRRLRDNLRAAGLAPARLARRHRPVVFVDLVNEGGTYANLFHALRDWIADDRADWNVIRLKLRFIGITGREQTSPHTWRWQQHQNWPSRLPADAIRNVSLDGRVWHYLGDAQPKLTVSFWRARWFDAGVTAPRHDDRTRAALAEAVALVEWGRQPGTRRELVRALAAECAFDQSWLRSLARDLRTGRR